jgi:hypothetical protein
MTPKHPGLGLHPLRTIVAAGAPMVMRLLTLLLSASVCAPVLRADQEEEDLFVLLRRKMT